MGYAPVNAAQALVGFGGVYVFTRLLGAEDYGRYALLVSAQAIVHTMTLTWAEAAAYRFAATAEVEGRRADHLSTMLPLMARSALLAVFAVGLLALVFRNDPKYLAILPWMAGLIVLNTVVQTALEMHKAHQRIPRYALVETLRVLSGFLIGAGLAWGSGAGAAAPFIGMAAASLAAALTEGRWLLTQAKGGRHDPVRARAALQYGAPIATALLLDILHSAGDRFMLAYFLDEAAVGAYAAGYGVADKTVLILCAWAALAGSPIMMAAWEREGEAGARREAGGLIGAILLVGLPAATGLALVAQPLAEVMIAEDLREQAMKTIPWIATAGLFNGMLIHYWSEAFQLTRKTGQRAILMLIPTLANLAANLFLIPWLGLMGAVYATVGSYTLGNFVLALAGRRHLKLPLPLTSLVKLLLATAGMAAVLVVIPDFGGLPELLVKALAGAAVYATLVFTLNVSDARSLLRRLKPAQTPD
jgi:O-antigen/teichoic acid export membrane protein